MTIYKFPATDKTLYGLATGTVYEPSERYPLLWGADGDLFNIAGIAAAEPDGVTDVRPVKTGDTISTVEELDALPNSAILRDENGAWEKFKGCFFFAGNEDAFDSSELDDDRAFTILWLPGTRNADS